MVTLLRPQHALLLLALAAFAALAWTALDAPRASAVFVDSDGDGVIDTSETLFGSNPNDAASTPETASTPFNLTTVPCEDHADNDLDGLIDDADPTCTDSEGDGIDDVTESLLGSDPNDDENYAEDYRFDAALIGGGYGFQLCANEDDDDHDGLIDGDDPGCAVHDGDGDGFDDLAEKSAGSDPASGGSVPEHEAFNSGSCSDTIDNDIDTLTDAADTGCRVLANDDIGDATEMGALPLSDNVKLLNAGTEFGESEPSCGFSLIGDGDVYIAHTVWYRYTPTTPTGVVVDTAGSDFGAVTAVWKQTIFGLGEVACNNNFSIFGFPSGTRLGFRAEQGQTYLIQAGSTPGLFIGGGNLHLAVDEAPVPDNDDFAHAVSVGSLPFVATANTIVASAEPGEPTSTCGPSEAVNTVWYRFRPASDTYVAANTDGSDLATAVAVYSGTSLANLVQVACGGPSSAFGAGARTVLGFQARAGQTYYIQAGGIFYGSGGAGEGAGPGPGDASTAGFGLGQPGGMLTLNVQTYDIPLCVPANITHADPLGDVFGFGAPRMDLAYVGIGFNSPQSLCIRLRFDHPPEESQLFASIAFDTDNNRLTGDNGIDFACGAPTGLGTEVHAGFGSAQGLIFPIVIYPPGAAGGTTPQVSYGTAIFSAGTVHVIVPLSAVGGNNSLSFAVMVGNRNSPTDCAPNGGSIHCSQGSCGVSYFRNGDANCDGATNSIDASLMLQAVAHIVSSVICPLAADVNGDGLVDSRDAALVLQFDAGLIDQLPTGGGEVIIPIETPVLPTSGQ